MRWVISGLVMVFASGLAACAGDTPARTPRPVGEPSVALTCDHHVEPVRDPSIPYGGVTLRWGERFLNIEPAGPPSALKVGGRKVWVWKAPVALSADTTAVLRITGPQTAGFIDGRDRNRPQRMYRRAAIASCPADTPLFSDDGMVGDVTGFGFGFVTEAPTCSGLQLEARINGTVQRAPLGRGVTCRAAGPRPAA